MKPFGQNDATLEPLLGSNALAKLMRTIAAVAAKDVGLTFIGESGTGKEVLARRAHRLSPRRGELFVPINCAAIPEALFESELFGHERGAFTGATQRVIGKIESAENGTLFLDEIGDMPIAAQAKLLRFLENRRYMRVGGSAKIHANVRLMCATHRSLDQDVKSGRFRADLYYRIQGITLQVPPLRERRPDIAPLLGYFISELSRRHAVSHPRLTRQAKDLLIAYEWPGNVRELRNVVESLCLIRSGRKVTVADLPNDISRQGSSLRGQREGIGTSVDPLTLRLEDGLRSLTEQIVQKALDRTDGSTSAAAALLRISPRTVQRYRLSGIGIPKRFPSEASTKVDIERQLGV